MDKYLKVPMVILLALTVGVAIFPLSAMSDNDTVAEPLLEDTFTIGIENNNALRSLSTASKVKGPKDKLAVRYFDDDKKCLATAYSITLNNGGSQKKERVTSAVVILNDRILYKQSDFNKSDSNKIFTGNSTTLPKALIKEKANVLEVKVNGKPGANIKIGIYGVYKEEPSESGVVTWYMDIDGDGWGSDGFTIELPEGEIPETTSLGDWRLLGGDCVDADWVAGSIDIFPGSGVIIPGSNDSCPAWSPPGSTSCP